MSALNPFQPIYPVSFPMFVGRDYEISFIKQLLL